MHLFLRICLWLSLCLSVCLSEEEENGGLRKEAGETKVTGQNLQPYESVETSQSAPVVCSWGRVPLSKSVSDSGFHLLPGFRH